MSETLPSGDSLKYQVTLLTRLVYGKSVVLDALIDNEDGKLFDRYGLHNLKELDFRRMIGIFYGYDMNYIQNADELWTLWGMGTLFEAESVEEFCYMKLAAPDLSLQVVYEAGTVYPDGSISDFIILENESVKKIDR
ncbi:uncharacterized protein LOC118437462 [Folsomia candida]|uniref:uncharacterized protein LOC118437462 n=1 Tax=Folsomia candida TaxID=158441 RepID=UPI0016053C52|nr:uncharacterized protein LOC118437462 [Folsomia candida]